MTERRQMVGKVTSVDGDMLTIEPSYWIDETGTERPLSELPKPELERAEQDTQPGAEFKLRERDLLTPKDWQDFADSLVPRDPSPALGELPVHDTKANYTNPQAPWHAPLTAADVAYLHAYAGAVGSKLDVDATIREKIRERNAKTFETHELDAIPYALTPKAHEALDAKLLADDPIQQMLPPAVPEVERSSFKLGVFVGLLVGWGIVSALPYIVELVK